MKLRVINLVDADSEDDLSTLACGHEDLVQVHRDLLEVARRGREYLEAAQVVNDLSAVLSVYPAADPRTVSAVVEHVVRGLRRGALSANFERVTRFDEARGCINQLRTEKRALDAQAKVDGGV